MKIGTFNGNDITVIDKLDEFGKKKLLLKNTEYSFDSLVRILPYDRNSKFDLTLYNTLT